MKRTVWRPHLCRNYTAERWSLPSTWHTQQTASWACPGGGWQAPGCVSGRLPHSSPLQPSPWCRGKPPLDSRGSEAPSPTGWWSAGLALHWPAGAHWTQCSLGGLERGRHVTDQDTGQTGNLTFTIINSFTSDFYVVSKTFFFFYSVINLK